MPRKESMALPDGSGSIPQNAYVMIRGINSLEDLRRRMWEAWDKVREGYGLKKPEKNKEMRATDQRLTSLEHDARQPRLAMEADGSADKKTSERTEGAATAVQAMHGDNFSDSRVDPGAKTNSTSFGVKAEPPTLPCRDDVVVENGAAAPKSCLSPFEMRKSLAAAAYFPPAKPLQQRRPSSTTRLFGSARPKRRILKRLQLHPPGTTAVS